MDITYSEITDPKKLAELYKVVSINSPGCLARGEDECFTEDFEHIVKESLRSKVNLGAYEGEKLIGFIYGFKSKLRFFKYLVEDITMGIHPDYQGKGLGRELLRRFMDEVKIRDDIQRVELFTVEENKRAISLYESFGFINEGIFKKRAVVDGELVNDIAMGWIKD